MEDGRSVHAAAAAAAKKEKNAAANASSREQPRQHPVPFAHIIPGITDALRERLEELDATEPSFVIAKSLEMSDVNRGQARLLFSCKRESPSESPVTAVFTKTEMEYVLDKTDKTGGLLVTALDRDGRSYNLTCKYLDSNSSYRFITGWKTYVTDNDLGVAMRVELWRFRSWKLPNRYEMRKGKDGKKVPVPVMVESGHPDGSIGLVLLHYGADEPDEALPVQEPEQAAADEAPPQAVETETGHMESKTTTTAEDNLADDSVTCPKPIKSKVTIAEDGKLGDDGGECAGPITRKRNTKISREDVYSAAKGLLKLRECCSRGGGGA